MDLTTEAPGYRILFAENDYSGSVVEHFTGVGNVENLLECECPNCAKELFPAINLSLRDERVRDMTGWARPYFRVLFCPFCALYMRPYWIRHGLDRIEIIGGYRDGGDVLQKIETPYACRTIQLIPLQPADYPVGDKHIAALLNRSHYPGVYHQIGGVPTKIPEEDLLCCDCQAKMDFAGILDYDDLNVPLYEDEHSPVALIIGDYDSLNIYSCTACSVLGLIWVK